MIDNTSYASSHDLRSPITIDDISAAFRWCKCVSLSVKYIMPVWDQHAMLAMIDRLVSKRSSCLSAVCNLQLNMTNFCVNQAFIDALSRLINALNMINGGRMYNFEVAASSMLYVQVSDRLCA